MVLEAGKSMVWTSGKSNPMTKGWREEGSSEREEIRPNLRFYQKPSPRVASPVPPFIPL